MSTKAPVRSWLPGRKPFHDARDWFVEKRLGMFVHWGVYALTGWHEQTLWRSSMPRSEYEALPARFNPVQFDPDRWLDAAESAGMEFLCFTAKHHDGFCMWDTAHTDYSIMHTPYRRDVLKMLSDACHDRGIGFGVYYSLPDWHHPNYPNKGRHHEMFGPRPGEESDEAKYLDYVRGQVRELCTGYGEITQFFWDVNVAEFDAPDLNDLIRSLQPSAVINDRCPGGQADFQTPERRVPAGGVFDKPTLAVQSTGRESWGYRKDEDYYSHRFLLQGIDRVLAMGGNYQLNVGPRPDGTLAPEDIHTLGRIGDWYRRVREAFDRTEPASFLVRSGRDPLLLTRKGSSVYVHLYDGPETSGVVLHPIDVLPERATLLNDQRPIECVVDVTPTRYLERPALRLRGIPVNEYPGEPMVIRLDFGTDAFG
ncbi:MAG: glycoside hydrolase [Kiritimatiellaeota bacterium]|nr:glycoside hydrolase [Kiritimatiellota bacterium]